MQTISERSALKDFAQRNFIRPGALGRLRIWLLVLYKKYEIGTYHNAEFRITHEIDQAKSDLSAALTARLKLEGDVRRLEQRL